MTAATVAIDPRIRARRVAVLRAQGRRRLRILLVLAGVLAVGAAAWGASLTPIFDVDRVEVTGVESTRADAVLRTAGLEAGMPMVFLDVDKAEQSVTALPWVKSASVRRDWPATVHIEVVQRVPVAVVPGVYGRDALVDAAAYVIGWTMAGANRSDRGLPHVSVPFNGPLGSIHTDADPALAVVEATPADLRPWVSTVVVEPDGRGVGLELVGGAAVVLGAPAHLDDKMSAVRAVLAGADLECVTEIDVTMPDIATVARHPSCRPQPH